MTYLITGDLVRSVAVLVHRGDGPMFLALKLGEAE